MNRHTSGGSRGRPFWRTPAGVPVLVAIIGAAATIVAALIIVLGDDTGPSLPVRAPSTEPSGTIRSPSPEDHVSPAFTVDGTLSAIPRDRHIWIAVQIGNLLFPKKPAIPSGDEHFAQEVVEGGDPPGGRFSVALLMVDRVGQEEIEDWLSRGRSRKSLPGLRVIHGSVKLDVVRDLLLEPGS